jgi:hypothetical protein
MFSENFNDDIQENQNARRLQILKGFSEVQDVIEKAKKMPIGSISNGRKKVAEGDWRKIPTGEKKQPKMQLSGSFNYRGESHSIKKVEDGIVHTTSGKMFKQSTLESQGVKFSESEIPKAPKRLTPKQKEKIYDDYRQSHDDYIDAKDTLQNLTEERKDLQSEMEHEAGQVKNRGEEWTDDDANRYGGDMGELDEKIEKQVKIVSEAKNKYEEAKNNWWETK